MSKETQNRPGRPSVCAWTVAWPLMASIIFCTVGLLSQETTPSKQEPPQSSQRRFVSPQTAAQALVRAAEGNDVPALIEIFGSDGKDLVVTQDPVQDKNRRATFAALAREKLSITENPEMPGRAVISVGNDNWPLPVPIVERNGKWYFDSKAGREEIFLRRIGANELDAIQVCRGFVEAQREYASEQHDNSGVNQYAQRIISTPGRHDGLAWQNPDRSWAGPLGEGIAKALQQGYTDQAQPYHGYFFKVLMGQGPAAPRGEMEFVVEGAMIGGFALAAAPAQYRVTGVKTFIVSYEGVVYEKDLGPDTLNISRNMERYNPDKSWRRNDDNW